MKRVLVVAAHPDDEVLGAGGAMARHAAAADSIAVLILGRGLASRGGVGRTAFAKLEAESRRALEILGVRDVVYEDFPDNALDSIPLLEVVRAIERCKLRVAPHRIYTHAAGDLNVDHRVTFDAVLTAFRPLPGEEWREILTFEVPSATHWRADSFTPSVFMDISSVVDRKLEALRAYQSEMRPAPHARSVEAAAALAQWRGAQMGVHAAEAFVPARMWIEP